jgi:hypothetical protein
MVGKGTEEFFKRLSTVYEIKHREGSGLRYGQNI